MTDSLNQTTVFTETRTGVSASIFEPGATLQKLAGGFGFTEGPTCDADGNVYFTDQPDDRILKWIAADGTVATFLQPCGRANGMSFDESGDLWACADEKNELWRISPDGAATVVVKQFEGKLLNGPNDVWMRPVAAGGGLFLTDPYYRRDYWLRGPEEQGAQGVYYLAPDGTTLTRPVSDTKEPNGLVGTPDGKTLYVADLGASETFAYDIENDGGLTNRRLFCRLGSDGMTIDSEGNVYLTGRGVTVFDRSGTQIAHIPMPAHWTGNLCFAGPDRKLLFITSGDGIYGIRMRVHGVGTQ